ncbi:hypothetical protein BDR07DRAFT_1379481 [Suillus spraguei]|nr:hypothetical protein BDR07DRAFT_1379481 [Suillus spraguei]
MISIPLLRTWLRYGWAFDDKWLCPCLWHATIMKALVRDDCQGGLCAAPCPILPKEQEQSGWVRIMTRKDAEGSIMLDITASTQPLSDTESNFDEVLDGDPEHVSIPAPSASKGELLETLRVLQVQIQWLQQENKSIKEENKMLQAEKPKWKQCADTQHELSIHKDTITIYACKYGMMVEIFPSATEESAFLDKLYRHFPELLHKIMESSYFSDLVLKSIPDAHANEIKKLRGVAGDIFGLSLKYFMTPHYDRAAVPEIQWLLGVMSATNLTYKTFPPVLFPDFESFIAWHCLTPSRVKWWWCPYKLSQVECLPNHARLNSGIFLLSPDTEFSSTGTGKRSNISYRTLFHLYKKVLVTKWTTKRIITIVTNINHYIFGAAKALALNSGKQEDYTDAIDHALAALDMDSDSDVESNTSAQNAVALAAENPIEVPQPTHSLSLGAIIEPDAITTNANAGEVHDLQVSALDILEAAEKLSEDSGGINSASGRGRAKMRGRKATPSGTNAVTHRGQSQK